jgi:hypothetical protein
MFDLEKYFVKPDLTEIRAELTAEATRLFQQAYQNGFDGGRYFEREHILDLLHDSIDNTPSTSGSMKEHWNKTIRAMIKKIRKSA